MARENPRQTERDRIYNDSDRENAEQNEEGTQAQDVADDARDLEPLGESERGGNSDPADLVPRDVPDLVEAQKNMVRSGRIDMDAFAGEEKMDDEDP